MMRSQRLDDLAALAASLGARVNRTGDGAFLLLYRGQRYQVVNLRALGVVVRQLCGSAA